MRGRVVAEMHEAIRAVAAAGVTTADLDRAARKVLADNGAGSNFLGYHGFPAVICASVNDEVIHGIPGGRRLHDGDLVSIDCGAIVDGWHGDAAFTDGHRRDQRGAQRLIEVAERALAAGIDEAAPGRRRRRRRGDRRRRAARRIRQPARLHRPRHRAARCTRGPTCRTVAAAGRGPPLEPGVVLAIEPMLIEGGSDDVRDLDDGWTVVTIDGSLAAHIEHTVPSPTTAPRSSPASKPDPAPGISDPVCPRFVPVSPWAEGRGSEEGVG